MWPMGGLIWPSIVQAISLSCSKVVIRTVTSYLPSGKSFSDSRSMWITNSSPTLVAGSPV